MSERFRWEREALGAGKWETTDWTNEELTKKREKQRQYTTMFETLAWSTPAIQ